MKTAVLLDAIGNLDEGLVMKAGMYRVSYRHKAVWPWCLAMAICLLLFAGSAVLQICSMNTIRQNDSAQTESQEPGNAGEWSDIQTTVLSHSAEWREMLPRIILFFLSGFCAVGSALFFSKCIKNTLRWNKNAAGSFYTLPSGIDRSP